MINYKQIRALIAKGDIENAMSVLISEVSDNKIPETNEIILQSARLNNLLRNLRMGVIPHTEVEGVINQITNGILSLMDIIESRDNNELTPSDKLNKEELITLIKNIPQKRNRKILGIIIFVIFILSAFSCFIVYKTISDKTLENELLNEGLKKKKDYIIPKITIRVSSELNNGILSPQTSCLTKNIYYYSIVSISYDVIALRDFVSEKIFEEYYNTMYATNILKEPGSEFESEDKNPKEARCVYDVITSIKKYEKKTITTRVVYLYEKLPKTRMFFGKEFTDTNWDTFDYSNREDDIIGEVEILINSRSLNFKTPNSHDGIFKDATGREVSITPELKISNNECLKSNILMAKIPKLKNNDSFGIKWSW